MSNNGNGLKGLSGLNFRNAMSPSYSREDLERKRIEEENEPEKRFRDIYDEFIGSNDSASALANRQRLTRNERLRGQHEGFLGSVPQRNIGNELSEIGYGKSRLDENITHPSQLNDIDDTRARNQSTVGKLANSVAKMGVLTATTAADSWIGLPAGIINQISELSKGNTDSARKFIYDSIDNPVSNYLQSINEASEEIFNNYQTQEERERPWWQNMFTANFIGDTLIKNAGFTIGAALGAKTLVNGIAKVSGVNEMRNAYKGFVAELGLNGMSESETIKALASGTNSLKKREAVNALKESARKLRNAEKGLQITGSLLAGAGEARIEAINGVNEFNKSINEMYGDLDTQRTEAINDLIESMKANNLDLSSQEGRRYYETGMKDIDSNYNKLREQITHDRITVGNTIFALNLPLLTASDAIQWGKFMIGDYKVERNIINGIEKLPTHGKMVSGNPSEMINSIRYASKEKSKIGDILGKTAAGSRNVFTEMSEEMNQSLISATAKAKAMGDLSEFTRRIYDPMALEDTVSWLNSFKQGMQESWLNPDDWVEGFAGAFMGFLGLPSLTVKTDSRTGETRPSLTMEGGVWSPIREYNQKKEARNKIVETINKRLEDPTFLNYYYGRIANRHFESIKEDAVKNGDKNGYAKADHAQLISDAIMFNEAGRLQDFIDIVDSFNNVSDSDIDDIKKLFDKDYFGTMSSATNTNDSIKNIIKDNTTKIKRQLDNYIEISDNLRTVYGPNYDSDFINEMTWQTAHLDEIEYNLRSLVEKSPYTTSMISEFRESHDVKNKNNFEIGSSEEYNKWLKERKEEVKDRETYTKIINKAIEESEDIEYYMSERKKYIENLSELSDDPTIIYNKKIEIAKENRNREKALKKMILIQSLSVSESLSEFINALDEYGEDIPDELYQPIKTNADMGNQAAKEFLIVLDAEKFIMKDIDKIASKKNISEDVIKQAKDAWNYLKHNLETGNELISKHKTDDVASDIAGKDAIDLLNEAIESTAKSKSLYDKMKKRSISKKTKDTKETSNADGIESVYSKEEIITRTKEDKLYSEEYNTKLNVTNEFLSKDEAVAYCRRNIRKEEQHLSGVIYRTWAGGCGLKYNGKPLTGLLYILIPSENSGDTVRIYDKDGFRLPDSEVKKITTSENKQIVDFSFAGSTRNTAIYTKYVLNEKKPHLLLKYLNTNSSNSSNTSSPNQSNDTVENYYLPVSTNLNLVSNDTSALSRYIKSMKKGDKIKFGVNDSGTIFLLHGDTNEKVGTLPSATETTEKYYGIDELRANIIKERDDSGAKYNSDGLFVSNKYSTTVREIFSSRYETTDTNIPINEIPGFMGSNNVNFMFMTKTGPVFSNKKINVSKIRRSSADRLEAGFTYLLIPNGEYYLPVRLYYNNINKQTLDLEDENTVKEGFGKILNESITKLAEIIHNYNGKKSLIEFHKYAYSGANSANTSFQNLVRVGAKEGFKGLIFTRDSENANSSWFENDDDIAAFVLRDSDGNDQVTIIKRGDSIDDVRNQILEYIYGIKYIDENGKEFSGPLFEFRKENFDKKSGMDIMKSAIDSGMLLANVSNFDLSIPSFRMDYYVPNTDSFARPKYDSAKEEEKKGKQKGKKRNSVAITACGLDISYDLDNAEIKIGKSDWIKTSDMSKNKELQKQLKKINEDLTIGKFVVMLKALAIIEDKDLMNDNESHINNKVLIRNFDGTKDFAFEITDYGCKKLTSLQTERLRNDIENNKKKSQSNNTSETNQKKEKEKEKIEVNNEEIVEIEDDSDELMITSEESVDTSDLENIRYVNEAISYIRSKYPQYSRILDYLSSIHTYDNELITMSKSSGINGRRIVGKNSLRILGNRFSQKIDLSKDSLGCRTLMHEIIHTYTSMALRRDSTLRSRIQSCMDYIIESVGSARVSDILGIDGMYAFESPYEFISEFYSNPELQELCKKIKGFDIDKKPRKNIFQRIIGFIFDSFNSIAGRNNSSLYDDVENTLRDVIDAQQLMIERGDIIYISQSEMDKAVKNSKCITDIHYSISSNESFERKDDALIEPSNADNSLLNYIMSINELFKSKDKSNKITGIDSFLKSNKSARILSVGNSAVVGTKINDVFVGKSVYSVFNDGSFESMVEHMSKSDMPIILSVNRDNIGIYKKHGFNIINESNDNDIIYISNNSTTMSDIMNVSEYSKSISDALYNNSEFVKLINESGYSKSDWERMSNQEKDHARKCIGI